MLEFARPPVRSVGPLLSRSFPPLESGPQPCGWFGVHLDLWPTSRAVLSTGGPTGGLRASHPSPSPSASPPEGAPDAR